MRSKYLTTWRIFSHGNFELRYYINSIARKAISVMKVNYEDNEKEVEVGSRSESFDESVTMA